MSLGYLYSKLITRLHWKSIINTKLARGARIDYSCNIKDCTIGRYTYISHDSQLVQTIIGAFCSISDHVFIGNDEHPTNWVTSSPVVQDVKNSGVKQRFFRFKLPNRKTTIIGNDVWIGHNVSVKAGVRIGDGAVIGTGAVVTKDVPPYAIVAGVPAAIIRYRFNDQTIKMLLETQWWKFDDATLRKVSQYMDNPELFISKVRELT